jgi:DNA-binding transcriptional ArsR family regulator
VFKALSDPTRRRVLQLLRERPMSAHFSVLQEAGLIEAEKNGRTRSSTG